MANKVYVTNETDVDFSSAEQFGELVFLTASDLHNSKASLHNDTLLEEIATRLRGFKPDTDYLLIAGSPYVAAAVFMILGHWKIRSVRILRWSNRDRQYGLLPLDLRREVTQ